MGFGYRPTVKASAGFVGSKATRERKNEDMISNKGDGQVIPVPRKIGTPRDEQPANRTSAGLRNALFDEIDALRRGDGDPQKANAVAQLAKAILMTAQLEYKYDKSGLQKISPLALGDDEERSNG